MRVQLSREECLTESYAEDCLPVRPLLLPLLALALLDIAA